MSIYLKLDSIACNVDLIWLLDDLESKDSRLAREAAEVFDVIIHLVYFDVLELKKAIDVPVGAAQVILALCVLNQIYLLAAFDCVAIWNQDDLAELADDMAGVWVPDCWVVFHLLIEGEVFMCFTNHERSWNKWLLRLLLDNWLWNFFLDLCLFFFLSLISVFSGCLLWSFFSVFTLWLFDVFSFRNCVLLLFNFSHFVIQ